MKKQRLIALMCAGIITTSTLAGCSKSIESSHNDNDFYDGFDNVYIVLKQNDVDVLHKGDMSVLYSNGGFFEGGPSTDYNYSFDCGQKIVSNATHALFDNMPEKYNYDKVCEECFGK